MISDTSLKAYREDALPTLGQRQAMVLGAIKKLGKATNSEIARELRWSINRITPRTFELRALGKVGDDGKRPCLITGRMAYVWVLIPEQKPLI